MIMIELQHVFSCFSDAFLDSYPVHIEGIKATKAIVQCRTAALGGHIDQCDACDDVKVSYNSCRNRNCPKCGNLKKEQWIVDRTSELLPVPYFHTVFTAPHELNPLFLANPKLMNTFLFKAASQTLSNLALDPKFLGAQGRDDGVAHMGAKSIFPSPRTLHCSWRWPLADRLFLCAIQEKVLYSRTCAF